MARGMKAAPPSEEILQYSMALLAGEEARLLERMWAPAERSGIPPIMIAPDQGRFLHVLLRAIRAKRVLDVGTLFGYSAAIMARALPPEGRVHSLEFDPVHAQVAKENLEREGLASKVMIETGPALASMKKLPANAFDLVLIDADKENYAQYLDEAVRLLRDGGVVAADNVFAFGFVADANMPRKHPDWANVQHLRRFNQRLAERQDVAAVLVPIGDGLAVGVVQKASKPLRGGRRR